MVRMLWPTGVPQDEIDIDAASPLAMKELDRRGSSCPVLFAWDGKQYQFVSDVIGAAVVGHWVSPTATNQTDPDEWIKVDGEKLQARNGLLSLRFGEPMEEVNYIDQLRLVAVDHPAGTEVYPDERFLERAAVCFGEDGGAAAPPVAARGMRQGNDVRELLAERDHRYVQGLHKPDFCGLCQPAHADAGYWPVVAGAIRLRFLLPGYVEYFSASSMYAAWQAGTEARTRRCARRRLRAVPGKRILARTWDFRWVAADNHRRPDGKAAAGQRRLRIVTNLQIYWDQILVDQRVGSVRKNPAHGDCRWHCRR